MGVEIERKFLVDHEKWNDVSKSEGIQYRQGYLLNDPGKTVRVRVSDAKSFLNLKSKVSQVSRKEFEYEIPLEDGVEILNVFTGSVIEKIRYDIPFAGNKWEVDVFFGDNAGLIVAEIELDSESKEFEKPEWVTTEVTDDSKYTNARLSVHPYKEW